MSAVDYIRYERDVDRLERQGLSRKIVRELRDAGPLCRQQVDVLLEATPEQIATVNAAAARLLP